MNNLVQTRYQKTKPKQIGTQKPRRGERDTFEKCRSTRRSSTCAGTPVNSDHIHLVLEGARSLAPAAHTARRSYCGGSGGEEGAAPHLLRLPVALPHALDAV
jgi:hypothetical protein